ncbi:hypothetical protein ZWY2020_025193 [Hordeum vulgare]|nr:hypothetical protein ZWY2020_025193 [Hordeum vulgare]
MGFRGDDSPATGGGISEKGRFSYGFASSAGKRASMEDFYETRVDDIARGIEKTTKALVGELQKMSKEAKVRHTCREERNLMQGTDSVTETS